MDEDIRQMINSCISTGRFTMKMNYVKITCTVHASSVASIMSHNVYYSPCSVHPGGGCHYQVGWFTLCPLIGILAY
jgi:hypothetical protein